MEKQKGANEYTEDWPDINTMSIDQLKIELLDQRARYEVMEKDLFKAQTNTRKAEAQLKSLQDLSSMHGVTHNNTSSAFTLPSEFKN